MPAEVEPPELALLVDFAERPRVGDWSLRSALCRYAQPQPRRVSEVLEVVRRVEAALHPESKRIAKEGPALWSALEAGEHAEGLVALLAVTRELDGLGEVLADWADERAGKHPEAQVDAVVAATAARLDELGVPREERTGPPPRGARSRG